MATTYGNTSVSFNTCRMWCSHIAFKPTSWLEKIAYALVWQFETQERFLGICLSTPRGSPRLLSPVYRSEARTKFARWDHLIAGTFPPTSQAWGPLVRITRKDSSPSSEDPPGSLPCTKDPAIGPYPEPDGCSPHSHTILPQDPFQYYAPIYAFISKAASLLQNFYQHFVRFSPLHWKHMAELSP
jgi:hypothetical protein